jgi:glycosyltransferase involved in cell wall biosynthesis
MSDANQQLNSAKVLSPAMPRKPKVVLDIAPLGWSWSHKQHARGIHRVAERTVSGLLAAQQCELGFMATSTIYGSSRLVAEDARFLNTRFLHNDRQVAMSKWAHEKHQWVAKTYADRRFHLRALRWLAQHLANRADQMAARFDLSGLATADIYHSLLAPIPAAIGQSRLKRFLTIYDLVPLTHPDTVNGKGVPLLRQQLDSLTPGSFAFCISQDVRHDLLNCKKMPPENVFVTPLAAAPETFYPVDQPAERRVVLQKYGIPDAPYFLTLSSFDPRKNFIHLIRCFGQLAEAGELDGCNLLLVGTNPERHTFFSEAIAQFPKLKHRIITPGFIPDEDLAAIYSGAVAFTFPTLSEGFGIPAVEAMQCGLPVISSNTTSMPEVIGDAGLLLDPHDQDAWCAAMLRVLRDKDLAAGLRQKSLARAKLFSWQRFIDETLNGYCKSLGGLCG